jgi:hypothetical protein
MLRISVCVCVCARFGTCLRLGALSVGVFMRSRACDFLIFQHTMLHVVSSFVASDSTSFLEIVS